MKKFVLLAAGMAGFATTAAFAQAPQASARDGVQTRAEVTQRVQTMFQRLDTDRDGSLTQQEIAAVRGKMRAERQERRADPARQQARMDRAFDRLDLNKDGSISKVEFAQARQLRGERKGMRGQRMGMRGGMGGRMFAMADANRDQRVTLQEATAAALQRFDRVDLNRDGRVTGDERLQARQQWQAQRRG